MDAVDFQGVFQAPSAEGPSVGGGATGANGLPQRGQGRDTSLAEDLTLPAAAAALHREQKVQNGGGELMDEGIHYAPCAPSR